jgi:glutathione peroxidase
MINAGAVIIMLLLNIFSILGCKKIKSVPETINMDNNNSLYEYISAGNFSVNTIDGTPADLGIYKGKKILIVNVASKCGYTPQYTELQNLHESYGDKVVVLGFPSNDFGSQEPGTNEEIKNFCTTKYNVSFPMFEKISVKGENIHPLYRWLTDKSLNGWNDQKPEWNFCKYLIDENGFLIKYFSSGVKPLSDEILSLIN